MPPWRANGPVARLPPVAARPRATGTGADMRGQARTGDGTGLPTPRAKNDPRKQHVSLSSRERAQTRSKLGYSPNLAVIAARSRATSCNVKGLVRQISPSAPANLPPFPKAPVVISCQLSATACPDHSEHDPLGAPENGRSCAEVTTGCAGFEDIGAKVNILKA